MKSYTDLEQSNKLSEFLPLESADMSWVSNGLGKPFARTIPIKGDPEELCACWSLAALLSVLPDEITDDDGDVYRNMFFHLKGKYIVQYPRLATLWPSLLSVEVVNLVDACVEMILKLHELKML